MERSPAARYLPRLYAKAPVARAQHENSRCTPVENRVVRTFVISYLCEDEERDVSAYGIPRGIGEDKSAEPSLFPETVEKKLKRIEGNVCRGTRIIKLCVRPARANYVNDTDFVETRYGKYSIPR